MNNRQSHGAAKLRRLRSTACFTLLGALCLAASSAGASESVIRCSDGTKVCRNTQTDLPARVLIRPATNVYDSPSTSGKVLKSNLPAFNPWYVFEQRDVDLRDPRQPKGWYAIGDSTKDRFGWIEAGNAIEWKSALVVSYTHPGTGDDRRTPTLMFDDLARVRTLMESPDRAALAEGIVKAIENGEKGLQAKYGVAMMEPRRFVDIERTPYILPVLDFEQFRTADRNARFLRIAAAIPQTETETGRGRTTLDQEAVQRQVAQRETTQGTQAATLGLDIKFVLDMTGSMQPYLDGTRDAINRMVRSLTADSSAPVRFGLVGFTDIDRECGDCNFKVARNWTKDELASGEQFVKILESDPTAKALGGGDLPETVFEGVHEAITSRWTENAIRMVVLIGDASSNQLGTDKNRDYSEHTIRSEADAQNVYMMALHIKPRGAEFDTALAEPQFKTMVVNPGQEQPPYIPVPADPRNPAVNRTAILEAVEPVVARLAKELQKVRRGDVSIVAADTDKAVKAESASLGARAEAAAGGTLAAALVSYLGDAAEPPNDVTAWTTDVDLADPTRLALDVRVLLEKRDLEDLTNAIDTILTALRRSRMTESDFFSELQAVVTSGVMARDISVSDATSLAGSGLLPKWLSSLPYKSAIQRLDATTYAALSPDDKVALDRELDAKIRLYKDYFNNSEIWHKLSPKHADLESVYPIRLADLP